jgi:hypothetical protein
VVEKGDIKIFFTFSENKALVSFVKFAIRRYIVSYIGSQQVARFVSRR